MLYQIPKLEIQKVEIIDVICASVGGYQDPDNPGQGQSDASNSWAPPMN